MKRPHYEALAESNRSYWWFIVRYRFVWRLIQSSGTLSDKDLLADIGCGAGGFLWWLRQECKVDSSSLFGVEKDDLSVEKARRSGATIIQSNIESLDSIQIPEPASVITMLDVLEHLENPGDALYLIRKKIRKDGRLIILVPAFQALWSDWDVSLGHHRRYSRKSLTAELTNSGWKVQKTQYLYCALSLPALIRAKISSNAFSQEQEFPKVPSYIDWGLRGYFGLESLLGSLLPFGTSVAALAVPDWVVRGSGQIRAGS